MGKRHIKIGSNAFISGGIDVGLDVPIAANSFVDFDVPDYFWIIGNPATIHHKENATVDNTTERN